jgi:hypothetical protein
MTIDVIPRRANRFGIPSGIPDYRIYNVNDHVLEGDRYATVTPNTV